MVNGASESPDDGNDWIPWYGPLAVVIGFFASIVTGLIIVVIGHSAGSSLTNPTPAVTDFATVAEEVGFVLSAIWVASWVARPWPAQFGLCLPRVPLWRAALAVLVGYGLFIVFSAIWTAVIDQSASEKYLVKDVGAHSGTIGVLASCLVLCVIAPFCEEFLFRGFIFGALRNWRGPAVAALLTGLLFGAIHVGSAPLVDLVPLALLGMLLCGLRQLTGSIYPGIALHSLNNAVALVVNADWSFGAFVAVLIGSFALITLLLMLGQRSLRLRLV